MTSKKSQQEAIEKTTGESVRRLNVPIDQLIKQGVLIDLQIGRWRAQTSLSLADIGVRFETPQAKEAASRVLRPGVRLLLPDGYRRRVDSIESCIRTTLSPAYAESHGARTYAYKTRWGAFIPATAFVEWKALFLTWQAKYFTARDRIVDEYEAWTSEIANDYLLVAADTRERMRKARLDVPEWDAMKEATLLWLRRSIPTPEAIRDSFVCSYDLAYIPTPEAIARDAEKLVLTGLADEKIAAVRAMQAEVVAQEKEAKQRLVVEFEHNVRAQLYGLVNEALNSLVAMVDRASINGAEGIGKRAAAKIAYIKTQVASLDLFEDVELAAELAKIDGMVTSTPEAMAVAAQTLQTYIKAQLASLALDLPRQRQELTPIAVPDLGSRARRSEIKTAKQAVPSLATAGTRSLK